MTSDTSPKTLTRSRSDRMLGGVAGGVAAYFGLDAALVRVGFVVSTLFTGGASILAYFAMLVIMPDGDDTRAPLPV
jgi:phage shock protein PspC (stress-responsive transcriptional regulator)